MPIFGKIHTQKNTSKNVKKPTIISKNRVKLAALTLLFAIGIITNVHQLSAQSLQQQINQLRSQNQGTQSSLNNLKEEAGSYQEAIAAIQAQIDAVLESIKTNEQQRDQLNIQIAQKTAELEAQRELLGKSIRAMYVEDDMSTLEMVVTSKSLSDYLDKEQYRMSAQNDMKRIVDEIKIIQAEMEKQKAEKEALIVQQQAMQAQLDAQRAEQSHLLSLNQAEQGQLNARMSQNNSRIAELRRQQAAENARLFSAGGGRRLNVPDTTGYPWAGVEPFPNSYPDPWGMYKRQCVSYTAWKVHKDGKIMPYWGGRGNAKNWPTNARAAGIPVSSTPDAGDIAISTRGTYGHAMYVESVLGNGMIHISQYNGSWDGKYSEAIISPAGLEFIDF
jgi:surface antigen